MDEKFEIMMVVTSHIQKDKETKEKDKARRVKLNAVDEEVLHENEEDIGDKSEEEKFMEGGIRPSGRNHSMREKPKESEASEMKSANEKIKAEKEADDNLRTLRWPNFSPGIVTGFAAII